MQMPVYSFRGYSLKEVVIKNDSNHNNTYITINVSGEMINNVYVMNIIVKSDFDSKEESYFKFESLFQINDMNWYNTLNEKELKMVFSSVVFPFVRERIYVMTTDLNPGLLIPMLDLKSFDVTKEIRLVRK